MLLLASLTAALRTETSEGLTTKQKKPMTKPNITALPFFNPDCGAIVVVRSDNDEILVRLAIQLALESGAELMSTTVAESMYDFARDLRDLYDDLEEETKDNEVITVAPGSPWTMPLELLGRAATERINQRFVGIIGKNYDSDEYDLKRLRTQVNKCGQKIAINFFCYGKKGAETNMDFDMIADYMLDAEEVDGEIVLTPEEFGGEPFPNPPIRFTIDLSNKWYPYKVKTNNNISVKNENNQSVIVF